MFTMLLEAGSDAATGGTGTGIAFTIGYIIILCAIMYLLFVRPQKKQQKQMDSLRDAVQPGDNIMTTGGFYGVVLDVVDDTVIVEFGNNKNCRIPMHKNAIAEVEKEEEEQEEEDKDSKKK